MSPDALDRACQTPHEAGPAELARTHPSVRALFLENALAPLFLTRGLRKLALTGAARAAAPAIAAQLWELANGAGGLPAQLELAAAGEP